MFNRIRRVAGHIDRNLTFHGYNSRERTVFYVSSLIGALAGASAPPLIAYFTGIKDFQVSGLTKILLSAAVGLPLETLTLPIGLFTGELLGSYYSYKLREKREK